MGLLTPFERRSSPENPSFNLANAPEYFYEALGAARVAPGPQDPVPLPHLADTDPWLLDLHLALELERGGSTATLSRPPYATTYWTPGQQLAHLTSNGTPLRTGDLLASGTVSGPERLERGCLLELSWGGREPLEAEGLGSVTFLDDDDVVTIRGEARSAEGGTITLGEVRGRILSAR